jgi:hypothetical protein
MSEVQMQDRPVTDPADFSAVVPLQRRERLDVDRRDACLSL